MAEISDEELAALRAAMAERDELRAAGQAAEDQAAADDAPPAPTHVAVTADGGRFEYSGAHPTEVHQEGQAAAVPVVASLPIS